ncbi:unnamed protein product [Leptosia nina]|uniref:Uncharacterized protein n=1 Tax=Leptosia nina TaxID=320188 RepID=A0AAV1JR73_9NEOP
MCVKSTDTGLIMRALHLPAVRGRHCYYSTLNWPDLARKSVVKSAKVWRSCYDKKAPCNVSPFRKNRTSSLKNDISLEIISLFDGLTSAYRSRRTDGRKYLRALKHTRGGRGAPGRGVRGTGDLGSRLLQDLDLETTARTPSQLHDTYHGLHFSTSIVMFNASSRMKIAGEVRGTWVLNIYIWYIYRSPAHYGRVLDAEYRVGSGRNKLELSGMAPTTLRGRGHRHPAPPPLYLPRAFTDVTPTHPCSNLQFKVAIQSILIALFIIFVISLYQSLYDKTMHI